MTHQELAVLADQLFEAETEVARLQAELKTAQQRVKSLSEHDIPTLMEGLGVDELKLKNGLHVEIVDKLSAKKLTSAHAAALAWLRENGQAGLIKTNVMVPFTPGSTSDAQQLVDQLAGEGYVASQNEEVNHMSLAAAIRSMLDEGVDVPLNLLGGYQRQVANVKAAKK